MVCFFLQALQRTDFNNVASRLGFERGLFASEWVDAFASLGGWLVNAGDLHHPWDHKCTWALLADIHTHHFAEGIEHVANIFAGQAGLNRNDAHDVALGAGT